MSQSDFSHAQQLSNAILALLSEAALTEDAEHVVALAVGAARFAAELHLRAQVLIGRELRKHPDPGGRPSTTGPKTLARALRESANLKRGDTLQLVRLAGLDDAVIEGVVADYWQSSAYLRVPSARSIVEDA